MRLVLTIATLIVGCNPVGFDDVRNVAPTTTFAPVNGYPINAFGRVLTTWESNVGGMRVSRLAASAGADTPFEVFPVFEDNAIAIGPALYDGCDREFPCMHNAGIGLAGMTRWGTREGCLAIPAPDSGEIVIRCEDDVSIFERIAGPSGQGLGTSAIGLGDHAVGRALFGAPGANTVYRLPDGGTPVALDLSAASGGDLGSVLAAGEVSATTILIAAGAPGMNRVVIATVDSTMTQIRACPAGPTGYGAAMAIGDLDGDGVVDVAIGTPSGIEIYDGSTLPGPGSCATPWTPAATVTCVDTPRVPCTASGFGSALAIGDLNDDGFGDLIVGAPMAVVDGAMGAGAVYALAGASTITSVGMQRQLLVHSQPNPGSHLGTRVAAIPGHDRVEIAASAPEVSRVYVFFCSNLTGDTPMMTPSPRCQP